MLKKILAESHEQLLAEVRRLLGALRVDLARFEAASSDQDTLATSLDQLDELFLLVVAGEFNAGKSTFINALLGSDLLEQGVTPTTTRIHTLSYADTVTREEGADGIIRVSAPVDLLRQVQIVDTPGTNALDRDHETITHGFVPRSDLVLFVTSADRPFTESERRFIESIREWGKKVVFVVNKVDILTSDAEIAEIERFIVENADRLLGFSPVVFPVSSRLALESKLSRSSSAEDGAPGAGRGGTPAADSAADLLARSRFRALETYLVETLDEAERVRLKLLNPLGVGLTLNRRYSQAVGGRIELLAGDFTALDDIERQLDLYQADLTREFRFRLTDVDNVLHEFEKRGNEFFEETIRLTRTLDLINKSKIKGEFERKVVADAPQQIEKKVEEVIDWVVGAELRQWQTVGEHLNRRRAQHPDRVIGEIGSFDYDRRQLLETVGRAAQRTVDGYDRDAESTRLADSVQSAVAGIAVLEVGALGLGAVITVLATTQLVDVTGVLAAGTLATLGLFVLPARRRKAKSELKEKIANLREELTSTVTQQFDQEIERGVFRIREAIAPYTRFVRSERERLDEMRARLAVSAHGLEELARRVERL
ncbi:MAG: dynamin family protein [Thermoleophilia bacterium]